MGLNSIFQDKYPVVEAVEAGQAIGVWDMLELQDCGSARDEGAGDNELVFAEEVVSRGESPDANLLSVYGHAHGTAYRRIVALHDDEVFACHGVYAEALIACGDAGVVLDDGLCVGTEGTGYSPRLRVHLPVVVNLLSRIAHVQRVYKLKVFEKFVRYASYAVFGR